MRNTKELCNDKGIVFHNLLTNRTVMALLKYTALLMEVIYKTEVMELRGNTSILLTEAAALKSSSRMWNVCKPNIVQIAVMV